MADTPGKRTFLFLLLITLGTAAVMYFYQRSAWTKQVPSVTVGVNSAAIASAPIFVATQGAIEIAEKVKIDKIGFTSGKLALDALLNGSVDVATAAETPVILARAHSEIRVLATLAESELSIVARKSKGITKPSDLKGKIIGAPEKTSAEYFLQRFL
ncbi:MAG: ABC transporter substrate-binding protein, partial [Nitrososphaera sp.]|nr:ABC transporter substrate-binding protein [Nitrososphaera sp.]